MGVIIYQIIVKGFSVKKVTLLSFLLPFALLANPQEDTKVYKQALTLYEQKSFSDSYLLFKKLYLTHLSDVNFNFYFGRTAYETGHYEMALAAFERVEMQDNTNLRNRLEMARTYFMLKMYEDSENAFKEVLANPNIPQTLRTNIELSLSRVSKVQQKSFTYAQVMLNLLYDSNVNYGSLGDIHYGGQQLDRVEPSSDLAAEFYANIVNIYDIGSKNGFALKNSLSFYMKEYFDEDDYSMQYFSYMPALVYKETKYTAEFILIADAMRLGSQHYLDSFGLMPKLQYNHTPTLLSLAFFKYQSKQFQQKAQENLDASWYELSYGLQKILSPRSYLQGTFYFITQDKKGGDNIYVDFQEYKADVTYANHITSLLTINGYGEFRVRDFSEYSSGFNSLRSDVGGRVNAGVSMKITPTFQANFKGSYEYIDSNQDRFSYDKYTLSAGLIKTF
jgi:hypothetical protein